MKVIAFYLPQFHSIPENDEWWGKGFTEWVNVKKARPLFEGHEQPVVPLGNNYYDLLDVETIKWQVDLAKKYNIYGFCFYHYWFNGHMLLEKPMELFYKSEEINHPYCICWANEAWTNAWKCDGNTKTLIQQTYGKQKEWEEHFNYLLKFFKDKNYIIEDNKPLFIIYRPEIIPCLNEMLSYWNELAIKNGYAGINFGYQQIGFDLLSNKDDSMFAYNIEYQPAYARYDYRINSQSKKSVFLFKVRQKMREIFIYIDKCFNTNINSKIAKQTLTLENYKDLCECIINRKATNEKSVAGFFVGWDNTPRRGEKGSVCQDSSVQNFKYYFKKQVENVMENYENDKIFMFAWNEWAEGGYLEPDERNKYGYLEAIKSVLEEYQ